MDWVKRHDEYDDPADQPRRAAIVRRGKSA